MAAAAIVHPQRSEIGRPLEAIITCAALLMGLIIGWTIVDASWRSFKEDLQAQEETRAAKEQQLAAEKENVQFQLDTAEANRNVDSQLKHLLKGFMGNSCSLAFLIMNHEDTPRQVVKWAKCINEELGTSIGWVHKRQVLDRWRTVATPASGLRATSRLSWSRSLLTMATYRCAAWANWSLATPTHIGSIASSPVLLNTRAVCHILL
jgi:uncharacterized membrane-anchored protein YhcB (DUF1043 family)